jgi:clan AA aspartic protease (TIGR02281 family)
VVRSGSIPCIALAWQFLAVLPAFPGQACTMEMLSDIPQAWSRCGAIPVEHPIRVAASFDRPSRHDDLRVVAVTATDAESGQAGLGADPGAGPSVLQHQDVAVPTFRVGQTFVVQVRLNGTRDAKLILDTGAEISLLSHDVVLDLGLFPTSSTPTVTLNTVSGTVRADVVIVESMAVGAAEAHYVAVAVHDLPEAPPGIDGLLGLTFLNHFIVTLDPQRGTLHLRRRD